MNPMINLLLTRNPFSIPSQNPNLGRKVESSGRRQRLSELCTRSLGALQDIAQKRRRNYILDQVSLGCGKDTLISCYISMAAMIGMRKYVTFPVR